MTRLVRYGLAALGLGLMGCGQNVTPVPTRNLDRPTDLTFACVQVDPSTGTLSGRSMAACPAPLTTQDRDLVRNQAGDPTIRQRGLFAFFTNSGRGEAGAVDLDLSRLLDLDPSNAGYGMIPVGLLPESLSASPDGCVVATANSGSCDLGLLDVPRAVALDFASASPSSGAGPVVRRVRLVAADGRGILSRPGKVAFLGSADADEPLCASAGRAVGGAVLPRPALVSLPGCDVVALVNVPGVGDVGATAAATVVSAMQVTASGLRDVTASLPDVCPVECGAPADAGLDRASVALSDGGALADGGAGATPAAGGYFIESLAVLPDGSRLYAGGARAPFVTAIDIDGTSGLRVPSNGGRIALHERPVGVTGLRLSIEPYAPAALAVPGSSAGWVGARGEFLYAITTDGGIRVIDVERRQAELGGRERECDVNVDPGWVARAGALVRADQPCFLVPETPDEPRWPRRVGTKGPGIEIPPISAAPNAPPPFVRDVAFANVEAAEVVVSSTFSPFNPDVLNGGFAFVLTSNGSVLTVNLGQLPEAYQAPTLPGGLLRDYENTPPLTHSFRNAAIVKLTDAVGRALGPPRLSTQPATTFPTDVAFPVRNLPRLDLAPRLERLVTNDPAFNPAVELPGSSSLVATWVYFPSPEVVDPQVYNLAWQGALPFSRRSSATVTALPTDLPASGDPIATVEDPGADNCRAGARPGDLFELLGCGGDLDCSPDGSSLCIRAEAAAEGICLPRSEVETLRTRCAPFFGSRRRYAISAVDKTHLTLASLPDEVVRPALRQCTTDADCGSSGSGSPWRCVSLNEGEPRRCLMPCEPRPSACRTGFVCAPWRVNAAGTGLDNLCVEAPPPDPACIPPHTVYRLAAGRSYVLSGNYTPVTPQLVARADGRCAPNPELDPRRQTRLALDAPLCANLPATLQTQDILVRSDAQSVGANPCLFEAPGAPTDDATAASHVKAFWDNGQFRTVITNLEYPAGDGVNVSFTVLGGFVPTIGTPDAYSSVAVPVRLITGPTRIDPPGQPPMAPGYPSPYLFFLDEGRAGTSGNRGQILRFSSRTARFDSTLTGSGSGFVVQ